MPHRSSGLAWSRVLAILFAFGISSGVRADQPTTGVEELKSVEQQRSQGVLADEIQQSDQRGDWDSEAFHEDIKNRLKAVEHAFSGQPGANEELRELLADDVQASELRPDAAQLPVIWRDQNLQVARAADTYHPARAAVDVAGLQRVIAGWREPFRPDATLSFHVKVFKVNVDGQRGSAEMLVDTDGPAKAGGGLQQNATWLTEWSLDSNNLWRLQSIQLTRFEEVVYQAPHGRLFADCTDSILAGNPQFNAQFRPGINQWRMSLNQSLGLDAAALVGMNVADVNNDGLDDVYFCETGGLPNRLFVQQPDGTAVDRSAEAGVDWLDAGRAALFADLDNDGDVELIVCVTQTLLVMNNDGAGHFTTVAVLKPHPTPYSISAADYDNDGRLDLYVCSYGNNYETFADSVAPLPYHDANNGIPNTLYRNEGNWKFTDVTAQVGLDVNNRRFSFAGTWADYDNDGDLDLYVANDFGRNNCYENDVSRSGKFYDRAAQLGIEDLGSGMSACWGDVNNDGRIDLYVGNMFSGAGNRITFQPRFRAGEAASTNDNFRRFARGNSLFINQPQGPFRDVSEQAGVTMGRWAWSSLIVDLNNDGWQDLFVVNGHITGVDEDDL